MNYKWISDIVIGLTETYGTNDVYSLCDFLNIEIIHVHNNIKSNSYFVRNSVGDEYVFVKPGLEYTEERALIAHELGHAILHTDLNVTFYCMPLCNKCKLELQANQFAAELLLVNIDFDKYAYDGSTIKSFAYEIEVPENLI